MNDYEWMLINLIADSCGIAGVIGGFERDPSIHSVNHCYSRKTTKIVYTILTNFLFDTIFILYKTLENDLQIMKIDILYLNKIC